MAVVYFDASALVKLVVEEAGTELAVELWDGCDVALASRLAYAEVCAALAAAGRNDDLSTADLGVAESMWDEFWDAVRPVELTVHIEQHAGELARRHGLRGADAVHLASALAIDDDIVIAVWDRRLHRAAVAEGLTVGPHHLPA